MADLITTRTEYAWEITGHDGNRKVLPAGEAGDSLDEMRANLSSWGTDWRASIIERTITTTTTDWKRVDDNG